jgi:hypothetical protein
MVKDAGEDCTAKSCFAAARLSDVVRGVKDDCKIKISLVAVHVIYVVMVCLVVLRQPSFLTWFFVHPVPLVMLYRTMIILELYTACASTKYAFLAHCTKLMLQPLLLQTACSSLLTDAFLTHCFKLMIQHLLPQTACFTVNCCFFDTLFELMLQPLLLQMVCFTVKWCVYITNLIPDLSYSISECAVAGMQMPRWGGGACCACEIVSPWSAHTTVYEVVVIV